MNLWERAQLRRQQCCILSVAYCCKDVVLTDNHAYELLDGRMPKETSSTRMHLCIMILARYSKYQFMVLLTPCSHKTPHLYVWTGKVQALCSGLTIL